MLSNSFFIKKIMNMSAWLNVNKKKLSIIILLVLSTGLNAQNVTISDVNFKAYLIGNSAINTNGDSEIQVSEATAFAGTINCSSQNISDLTGIEAFGSITRLYCYFNSLNSLDLSNNTSLTHLRCYSNILTSLDLTNNTSLEAIRCYSNSLTSLNIANGNNNNVTYFDVRSNPNLTCITVDNVTHSNTNWANIDAQASFSTSCTTILVSSINVQGQGGASTISTSGGTLQMEATILPANADDVTYTWSVVNQIGSATIDANGLLTAIADGTVDVIATANDASGVIGTETITISNQSVSVNENDLSLQLSIHPNPVQNELFIELNGAKFYEIVILDYSGRIVKSIASLDIKNIDISELKQGVYFLQTVSKEGTSTCQFFKQ